MPVDIVVPSQGESVTSGMIAQWYKKSGDLVRENEPLFELESDKAALEVSSPASGVLTITKEEGEEVEVGSVVGSIEEKEVSEKEAQPSKNEPPKQEPKEDEKRKDSSKGEEEEVLLSPAARQLVADEEVDPTKIEGTGRDGRILKEDVLRHLEESDQEAKEQPREKTEPETPDERGESRKTMSPLRQRIATRLVQAQSDSALLTTFNEVDMSEVMSLRKEYKESFREAHGVGLGFMSFFVKAACEALRAFPQVNARIDGNDIVTYHYCDIGVAVSTDKGLVVPVLRNAERMSFAEIEQGINSLAGKARDGKIALSDLQGGTFTITNGGVFGSLLSTPIVNPPQSGILGMHAIQDRPVVVDGEIVIRPMMYLAITYDHRLIDGKEAVSFLVRIKQCIESPARMLLEV